MLTTKGIDDLEFFCQNPPGDWRLIYLKETVSTNCIAMEHGLKGVRERLLVVAGTQTGGRGRLGKQWQSYAGCGLYFSIVLRPKLKLAELSRITLAAGVALAETAAHFCTFKPMLKWPNDLIINGLKCGGILAESDVRNGASPLVVLGIGVNIHTPEGGYPNDLRVKAGALDDMGQGGSRVAFLQKLVPAILMAVADLEQGRFAEILKRWQLHDYTKGKKLTWLTAGGKVVEGICEGINNEGLLFIIDGEGIHHEVLSGDVQLA